LVYIVADLFEIKLVKDTVRFLDKPYTGIVGEIRYIYRSWVFVYCRTYPENSGMMVAKSKQVALVGGGNTNSEKNSDGASASSGGRPAIQHLAGSRRGGRGSFGNRRGGGGNQVDRSLIGKSARIIAPCYVFSSAILQGTLKGLTGIICDATAKEVLMELHSQFKKVHVLRMNVGLLDRSGNLINDGRTGAGTPRPTPMREPRTPMAGSMTPRLGSMTPRADATPLPYAFNPTLATPAHFAGDDGSSTPGYQPWQTPDLSRTPRSGLTMDDEDDD
uniref:Spt5-NGN domain-containing protein n=1 Tax=Rodentolepis nana TaxID=102285 RepID=A0A0R3TFV4_RODNA